MYFVVVVVVVIFFLLKCRIKLTNHLVIAMLVGESDMRCRFWSAINMLLYKKVLEMGISQRKAKRKKRSLSVMAEGGCISEVLEILVKKKNLLQSLRKFLTYYNILPQ